MLPPYLTWPINEFVEQNLGREASKTTSTAVRDHVSPASGRT
jgi:hypothetical protein